MAFDMRAREAQLLEGDTPHGNWRYQLLKDAATEARTHGHIRITLVEIGDLMAYVQQALRVPHEEWNLVVKTIECPELPEGEKHG